MRLRACVVAALGAGFLVAAGVALPGDGAQAPASVGESASDRSTALAGRWDTPEAASGPTQFPVVLAAGDIATCKGRDDERTARILGRFPGAKVLTLGDNVYERGTPEEFERCYEPSWGIAKGRTRPVPGNHDYGTDAAAGYFGYFGKAAGNPNKGYYSYDLGDWHVLALNSNCSEIGGCERGSPQERWLRSELQAARGSRCTLAYWHHPRFSSGKHGNADFMRPIWETLYAFGADVVLSGHDHDYERFAPQTPGGKLDRERGVREFVVGTGGKGLRSIDRAIPNSQVRNDDTHGVLKLTLRPRSYRWQFLPEEGKTFTDTGSAACR